MKLYTTDSETRITQGLIKVREATQEQTEEYLSSLQEDRAIAAQERAIHIGEHRGALDE